MPVKLQAGVSPHEKDRIAAVFTDKKQEGPVEADDQLGRTYAGPAYLDDRGGGGFGALFVDFDDGTVHHIGDEKFFLRVDAAEISLASVKRQRQAHIDQIFHDILIIIIDFKAGHDYGYFLFFEPGDHVFKFQ